MSDDLLFNRDRSIPISWRVIAFSGAVAIVVIAFGRTLQALALHALRTDLHSHIVLVPFVSLYLAWQSNESLPKPCQSSPWVGGGIGALSIAAMLVWLDLAKRNVLSENDSLTLFTLSFVGWIWAAAFSFLGRGWVRATAFPLLFLVFMVPLPDRLVYLLEQGSATASAEIAGVLFTLTGTPHVRAGTVFQLPGIILEVAQECSGIRSSWVLVITSLVASHLFLRTRWRKALLVFLILPLGLLRNGVRILILGLLCVHVGPQMIHSPIHHRGGPIFFAASLLPLFLLLWFLRRQESGAGKLPAGSRRVG